MNALILIAGALIVDFALGDPEFAFHPVRLMGKLAASVEGNLRSLRLRLFAAGTLGWLIVVGSSAGIAALLLFLFRLLGSVSGGALGGRIGFLAAGIAVIYCSIAPRDLAKHALKVKKALETDGLQAGRDAVSLIVGRDVDSLDEAGVIKACVESVAESATDGVIAPIFWALILGPAGAIAYRAANTLDSLWGHKSEAYLFYGRFAARADDAANWIPARVGFFVSVAASALLGLDAGSALRLGWRDRRKHESPNAAWLEAAFAGALGLRLGGPCRYSGELLDKPYLGDGNKTPVVKDIARAVGLMYATVLLFSALGILACFALRCAAALLGIAA
jgi:adenosylcobinamide-phosphate synthase